MSRHELISDLADRITNLNLDRPVRVGVSGITASGKTTLANEIAEVLHSKGQKVERTSIDNFHNSKAIRYKQGKESAIGYYEDAHDYEAFKQKLLIPLGSNGSLHYETSSLDLDKDVYVKPDVKVATKGLICVIDGTFLFKKELRNHFDFKIFVDTDFEIARRRGSKREEQAFGSISKAEEMFIKRYHAASKLYLKQESPQQIVDVIFNNNDLDYPTIIWK
ncbi:uridine kinase [Bacillus solimangrovi]|uniref:Uridine kinase n=1 Tax=Bacillus solimangrovi TaxID=1305675 RepID=A0A1E5LHT8_9BACI|nr:uridine kinase [Bacillus solimangrovi]OEH93628.1 uridine kinase [Bacillus solimangrovi]